MKRNETEIKKLLEILNHIKTAGTQHEFLKAAKKDPSIIEFYHARRGC